MTSTPKSCTSMPTMFVWLPWEMHFCGYTIAISSCGACCSIRMIFTRLLMGLGCRHVFCTAPCCVKHRRCFGRNGLRGRGTCNRPLRSLCHCRRWRTPTSSGKSLAQYAVSRSLALVAMNEYKSNTLLIQENDVMSTRSILCHQMKERAIQMSHPGRRVKKWCIA
jgi:hypothetical protein